MPSFKLDELYISPTYPFFFPLILISDEITCASDGNSGIEYKREISFSEGFVSTVISW